MDRDARASQLAIDLDKARLQLASAAEREAAAEERVRRQLADAAAKAEASRAAARAEMATMAEKHAAEKHEIERRAAEADDRLATLRAELSDEFDAARHSIAAELRQKVWCTHVGTHARPLTRSHARKHIP